MGAVLEALLLTLIASSMRERIRVRANIARPIPNAAAAPVNE
jgi:hypothetical protein